MTTRHSHKPTPADDGWRPCPEGELRRLASRLKNRRRRETLARLGVGGALLLALGVGVYAITLSSSRQDVIGGLTCQQVHQMLPQYIEHKLSAAEMAQVKGHLAACPACSQQLRQMRSGGHVSLRRAKAAPSQRNLVGRLGASHGSLSASLDRR